MFVLDSHCDTPSQILRLRDISIDNDYAHVDIPKLKRGGVDGVFFALYVPAAMDDDPEAARTYAYKMLAGVRNSLDSNPAAWKTDLRSDIRSKSSDDFMKPVSDMSPCVILGITRYVILALQIRNVGMD